MVSLPLTCIWYGFPSDGIPYIGLVVAWFGTGNSGTGIARVRVGKVYRETLHLAPLLIPLLTLLYPTLAYLVSVLGLLWVHTGNHCSRCYLFYWYLACPVRQGSCSRGAYNVSASYPWL